jgi:hypothetical protein
VWAQPMRDLGLLAVRTLRNLADTGPMVRTPLITARFGYSSLWDCHRAIPPQSMQTAGALCHPRTGLPATDDVASIVEGRPTWGRPPSVCRREPLARSGATWVLHKTPHRAASSAV